MLQSLKQTLVYCAPYQLCNERMSWMIEIWMKKHLVSDSIGNNIDLLSQKIYKE